MGQDATQNLTAPNFLRELGLYSVLIGNGTFAANNGGPFLHDDALRRGNCRADSAACRTSSLRKRWRNARLLGLAQEAQSDRDGLNIFNVAGRAAALAAFSISDVQKEGPLRCGLHSGPSYAHNRVSSDRRDR